MRTKNVCGYIAFFQKSFPDLNAGKVVTAG